MITVPVRIQLLAVRIWLFDLLVGEEFGTGSI